MKICISEKTLPGDIETPVSLYLKLKEISPFSFLLESVVGNEVVGRYSFIGIKPFEIFKSEKIGTDEKSNKSIAKFSIEGTSNLSGETSDPFEVLNELLNVEIIKGIGEPLEVPFYGGLVGYISYDAVKYIERIPDNHSSDLDLPDFYFVAPSIIVCFDNVLKLVKIMSIEPVTTNERESINKGIRAIDEVITRIKSPLNTPIPTTTTPRGGIEWVSNVNKESFIKSVEKAKKYIENGDIFQVVLSQRLNFNLDIDPFDVYRNLRMINPSPYMFYLNFGDIYIVGSSPEMLVKVWNGVIETRPIAGTRPRGKNHEEDKILEKELLSDEKELAEHTMLVDLARNDIGRVSKYGSVKVNEYMTIEKYSHVMHIVSDVTGELKEGARSIDVMKSVFPAGTVSGAPKVRAMEIIDELENTRRGPYAGAVAYFSYNGNMDSAITLRTMVAKGEKAYIQAGAGIVYDSVPESEYNETINKAKAVLKAVEMARGEQYAI